MVVVNRDLSFTVEPSASDHPKCKELAMADPDLQIGGVGGGAIIQTLRWGGGLQKIFLGGPLGLSLV